MLGSDPLEGYLAAMPISWWSDRSNPAIQLASKIHAGAQRGDDTLDAAYLIGLGAADLGVEALDKAVEIKGSRTVSGEDVLEQMAVIDDYAVMGGLYTLNYTAGNRQPTYMQLWQVSSGGDWVPLGTGGNVPDLALEGE